MKSFTVACLHGDEVFGLKVLGILDRSNRSDIVTRVGHPEAIAKNKRYIETDLNRSFGKKFNSIESEVASAISKTMSECAPDYIIDIHTSRSNVRAVAIVSNLTDTNIYLAHSLRADAIVVMPRELTVTSLIGCMPDRSISLEFGVNQRSDKLAAKTAEAIQNLGKTKLVKQKIPIYTVISKIPKNYKGLSGIKNLEFDEDLRGYPFLAGINTYPDFGGFLAKKISKNTSDINLVYNGEQYDKKSNTYRD